MEHTGKLYVVAVPLGNVEDITLRALNTLKTVEYILAEDTRTTDRLLSHFELKKPIISYRDQNHLRIVEKISNDLANGINIALVSDNGTPLISDPGFKLISALRQGVTRFDPVVVPGANAAVATLSISGLPTDNFTFCGFLPKTNSKRKNIVETYGNTDTTLIFYESPFRIRNLMQELYQLLGNRKAFVAKDLTKTFEETFYGNLEEFSTKEFKEKGEYTVVVAKKEF